MMAISQYSIFIIVITVIISLVAFNNIGLMDKLILWPARMDSPNQYYRLLTSGFIHADYSHLFFNMFSLYFVGRSVEFFYAGIDKHSLYIVLYLTAIIVASLPSFTKNRHNHYYRSLGASGGVSAILVSGVYFQPWSQIYVLVIPMPYIVFAILFIGTSYYLSRKGGSYINHEAHLWGAIYGLIFTFLIDPSHGQLFIQQLMQPRF